MQCFEFTHMTDFPVKEQYAKQCLNTNCGVGVLLLSQYWNSTFNIVSWSIKYAGQLIANKIKLQTGLL